MLRVLHAINLLLILPMVACGFMSSFSGGGLTPAYQNVGRALIVISPIMPVICVIIAEVLWRYNQAYLAYIVNAIPLLVWVALLVWLQIRTGFFG
jgi:hypothetical protein